MIVMKFGGTSVESAEAIERVAGIVREHLARRPVVVVSAMGKTTNKLLAIAAAAVAGHREKSFSLFGELREFHEREAAGMGVEREVCVHFEELSERVNGLAVTGEMTPRTTDAVSAFGERLSSIIVSARFRQLGIDAAHVDSRAVIVTDERHTQAAPIFPETYRRLAATVPPMTAKQVVVMGGFIGSTEKGVTTTLGRGGSDYTASIVGAAIGAEEIQIWTDVDGMLTSDPAILANAYRVKQCSFAEAAELAYFGAKVLHPATVLPAIEKNIPVRILNSRRPQMEGTLITAEAPHTASPIRSIACKRNITLVNIVSSRMLMAHGFLRRIFEIFDRFETPVDMLATSEVSVSLTIDNTRALEAIRREIEEFAEVTVDENQSIVCLVGDNIRHTPGLAARAFGALNTVNVRMISQGASRLNISLVVAAADLHRAVESLHREFFTDPDSQVFAPSQVFK
ncbi:MAG TPA: lysine-sensitive aspartokinase 3 [Bryobacteraceae bacterium]|nr:lysine-sensitive aspartokinase 3 [Bryobacteraceae bacterium]